MKISLKFDIVRTHGNSENKVIYMEFKSILLIIVVCLLVHVEFSESKIRKNRNIYSAFCETGKVKTNGCLMKIHNYSAGQTSCQVRIDGSLTTDPATRFTIVNITTPAGKNGKCIEFTTGSQVKYALKAVTTTNIIFEKQQNGCHDNIANDFIFIESKSAKFFSYTHNSKCLATDTNGTLFLKSTNDASKDRQCKYRLLTYQ